MQARPFPQHRPAPRAAPAFRTFVISLARAHERRAHIRQLIDRLGLDAEIVDAVDGSVLTTTQLTRYDAVAARRVYGCEMSPGEIACCLSHFSIFERMIAGGVDAALVFEDDIDCEPDIAFLASQLCALPADTWSLVRLETLKPSVAIPQSRRAAGRRIARVAGRDLDRIGVNILGAGAYLIRRPAAEAMLAHGRHIFMPFDQMLDRYWENGIAPMIVRPPPARQAARFGSIIGARGRATKSVDLGTILARRRQRAIDSFDKRMFWIALKVPTAGAMLRALGVAAAWVALASLSGASMAESSIVGQPESEPKLQR
jgi:glycosyl transferase family 25